MGLDIEQEIPLADLDEPSPIVVGISRLPGLASPFLGWPEIGPESNQVQYGGSICSGQRTEPRA
jgi:hypothetical protein